MAHLPVHVVPGLRVHTAWRQQGRIVDVDAKYIHRIVKAVRYTEVAGRGLLFFGIFPPFWLLGTMLLAVSKILENMELGHNVMHGQYDFMNDPELNGKTYERDIVSTGDSFKYAGLKA